MKRRLTRAKSKIKVAGIPFAVQAGPRLPERLAAILAVVYLIFDQGYGDHEDRSGLGAEAIRLGRVLAGLLPAEAEVLGLLALMLLHDARREARFAARTSSCSRTRIGRGGTGVRSPRPAPCSTRPCVPWLRAAVRTLSRRRSPLCRPRSSSTGLDRRPVRRARRPDRLDVVRLNRAVAIAEAEGPGAALAVVDGLDLPGYQYWHSTRAELLRRLGRADEARAAYRRALDLARTVPERRFLERRIAES